MLTKKFSKNSYVYYDALERLLALRHYDTDIIRVANDRIIVYTRHKSNTDKKLINSFFQLLRLPISIFQRNYQWFINVQGSIEPVREASYCFSYNRPYAHTISMSNNVLELAKKIFTTSKA